jgi:hypothetical protein
MGFEGVDWTDLAHDGDRWGNFVNTAVNFPVP